MHIVGHLTGGLPCSTDPRVWLLDEVVICLKERKSVVQVSRLCSSVVSMADDVNVLCLSLICSAM